jgi:hypothetical protein
MKQFLIAIALTMSVTIGVSAQVPRQHLQSRGKQPDLQCRCIDGCDGRILGVK